MPAKLDNKYSFANGGANSKSFLQPFFVSQTLCSLQDRNSDWVFCFPFNHSRPISSFVCGIQTFIFLIASLITEYIIK